MGELRCTDASQEALSESLLRMASVGVRQFHFLMQEVGWMRLLASQALVGAAFVSFRILPGPADQPTLIEVQELADDFLRNSPGKRVSFMMPRFCPVVCPQRIIERFLEAEKPGEFNMPLSVQLEFWGDSIPVPAECRYPTLRNVIIPAEVLVRHRKESVRRFDVYHFRNARTKEHLTVCLGKRNNGNVSFVFIQKGRFCATVEDIANTVPFPYQLAD